MPIFIHICHSLSIWSNHFVVLRMGRITVGIQELHFEKEVDKLDSRL